MSWQRKAGGSLVGFIGFMLSPLSWWNDLFVNVPLAVGFGWLVAWVYPPAFNAAVVVGYWMTNVLGLVLLHKGGEMALTNQKPQTNRRRQLLIGMALSLAYTLLIVLLVWLKVLAPVSTYLGKH